MSDERKKHGSIFWTAAALVVFVLYPLSYGPACYLGERTGNPKALSIAVAVCYMPMALVCMSNARVGDAMMKYGNWWIELANK